MKKNSPLFFIAGLFFIFDQIVKFISRNIWTKEKTWNNLIGWHPFKNTGAAFSIPLPQPLTITVSFLILLLLIYIYKKTPNKKITQDLGLLLIISGAISNLLDRILLGYTTDYLLLLTGVMNIADILIVLGFGLYITTLLRRENVYKT